MAVRIIDLLEIINIEHQQARARALLRPLLQHLLGALDQEAAVGQLDQWIHPAQPLQLAIL